MLVSDDYSEVFSAVNSGLNPYYVGCWSQTWANSSDWRVKPKVLILIMLDAGLRRLIKSKKVYVTESS